VLALVRCSRQDGLNRLSVARLHVPATSELPTGEYALVLYILQSTGLRPLRRLEAVVVPLATGSPMRMAPEWLGQFLDAIAESEQRGASADTRALDRALGASEQLVVDVKERERAEIESRQNDLVQLRLASLQFAFERKRERLRLAISTLANPAIKRLRQGELANATARHEAQLAALREQNKVAVTYDRVAAAILDVL
jgi:hypothetical protein